MLRPTPPQVLPFDRPVIVSLNPFEAIAEQHVLGRYWLGLPSFHTPLLPHRCPLMSLFLTLPPLQLLSSHH